MRIYNLKKNAQKKFNIKIVNKKDIELKRRI